MNGVVQKAIADSSRRAIAFIFVYNLIYVTRRFTSSVD
ncbi:hypothetical protein GXM_06451 [Nostoc sphaeroides CCNUC1]|uniref:Uncharacterized protein n=1 Tax=Nostoc sphaeroides CCNUC1 TaxID=2653204 RepID=A0A5P8W833_9NOSO|nr:hypothetical protein GXM_06451 [Nostoc sphaeroides CCNUC1]